MTSSFLSPSRPLLLAACLGLLPLGAALASPGAHGPNGEHLDGPPSAAMAGSGAPRIEAHSELFEIVGKLEPAGLVLYISRYETNVAVLGAKVEVELGAAKALLPFQAEAGTYVLGDKAMLAALDKPGRHALVFTITAGTDADLLEGTLPVAAHDEAVHVEPGAGLGRRGIAGLVGGGVVIVLLAGWRLRRSRKNNNSNSYGAA